MIQNAGHLITQGRSLNNMRALTVEQTTSMIIYACEAIIEKKAYLTEVDSKIGDGDHGIGMSGGMKKAKKHLRQKGRLLI